MTSIAVNKDEFISRCEVVYQKNRDMLEREHYGRLVALYEDGVAGIADTTDEVFKRAEEKFPDKIFYVRRIGKNPAAEYLL
jgi:hypothetical protein